MTLDPPGNKHYLQGHFKVNSPSMGRFKELGQGDRMHPFGAGWMPQFIRIGQGHCWEWTCFISTAISSSSSGSSHYSFEELWFPLHVLLLEMPIMGPCSLAKGSISNPRLAKIDPSLVATEISPGKGMWPKLGPSGSYPDILLMDAHLPLGSFGQNNVNLELSVPATKRVETTTLSCCAVLQGEVLALLWHRSSHCSAVITVPSWTLWLLGHLVLIYSCLTLPSVLFSTVSVTHGRPQSEIGRASCRERV